MVTWDSDVSKAHPSANTNVVRNFKLEMNRYIYVLVGLILGFLLALLIFKNLNPFSKFESIEISLNGQSIYLKKINWGLLGNHQLTAISDNDDNDFDDKESDYIDTGLTEMFYNTSGDTLILFLRHKFKEPDRWDSKIKVKQVILENPQFMNLYDEERNCVRGF